MATKSARREAIIGAKCMNILCGGSDGVCKDLITCSGAAACQHITINATDASLFTLNGCDSGNDYPISMENREESFMLATISTQNQMKWNSMRSMAGVISTQPLLLA
eukprot:68375_1